MKKNKRNMGRRNFLGVTILAFIFTLALKAGANEGLWSLDECIDYALSKNITVQKAELTKQKSLINLGQSKANRLPSVDASVSQSFSWGSAYDETAGEYSDLSGSASTAYGVNSSMTLFNGFKLKTLIDQAELDLQSNGYYAESVKESVELNILNAYLQILYAREEVKNAEKQIESTEEQLVLADERMNLGVISKADYLQIKSELASEKLTLSNAKSTLQIAKVNLMQLMEYPVSDGFEIEVPDMQALLDVKDLPVAANIYEQALGIKPQVRQAELAVESVKLEEKLAKADLYPSLSVNAGVNTGWSNSLSTVSYAEQVTSQVSPTIGFNLSIPIFQKTQVKNNIKLARLASDEAQLDVVDTQNNLRKEIEQATVDYCTAQSNYDASREQYDAVQESYQVATEKYNLGILNSVDFLIEKTKMITSESSLLQAKYDLIFSNKILDFYKGVPIRLVE